MLVLTTHRVLYEPMRTPRQLIEPAADLFGQGALGKLIGGAIDVSGALRTPWSVQLAELNSVVAAGRASLRIALRSGESYEIEITQSLWSPRFSSGNGRTRDEAVELIRASASDGLPDSWGPPPEAERGFVGTWRVTGVPGRGDWGSMALGDDGRFTGTFVMFGAAPNGSPVAGTWWLTSPYGMLVIQGRLTEMDPGGPIVLPFQLWLGFEHVSPDGMMAEWLDNDNQPVSFERLR